MEMHFRTDNKRKKKRDKEKKRTNKKGSEKTGIDTHRPRSKEEGGREGRVK